MTADTDMLEANIKNLERENRELRITLRDRFAMAAITGLIGANRTGTIYGFAKDSYAYADAMLEVREK